MAARRLVSTSKADMIRIYLSKPDVYPIIGIIACALGFMTYKGIEHIRAPDVVWNRERRGADAWEKFDANEGDAWRKRVMKFYRHKDDELRNLSIFEPLSPSWWSRRAEVAQSPERAVASGKNHLG